MEYEIAIIGGGPAGYTAAETAGKLGMKVVLFEEKSLGGVCLNEGCIPTKTLLYSAKVHDYVAYASKYGVMVDGCGVDLPKVISRKQKVVRKLVLGIKSRMTAHQVNVVTGIAMIEDAHHIRCGEEIYECKHLIICTGSETFVPPIKGLEHISYWTHREALENKEIPTSLVIVGGGVIGMEFASFFNSLGTEVTVIEMTPEILGGMDGEIAAMLRAEYAKRGVKFLLSTKVVSFEQSGGGDICVTYQHGEDEGHINAARLLMSAGRKPRTIGYGLEVLGLKTDERRRILVDEHLESSVPGVYVCGDLNGTSLLAHTAVREAEVAVHHIAGIADKMSYEAIPAVVYTNPEVAAVGKTELQLQSEGVAYKVHQLPMGYSGRFVAENEGGTGLCKILTDEKEVILGVHLLGNPCSEIITQAVMAIELRLTTEQWKRMVFPHPSVSEIIKETL